MYASSQPYSHICILKHSSDMINADFNQWDGPEFIAHTFFDCPHPWLHQRCTPYCRVPPPLAQSRFWNQTWLHTSLSSAGRRCCCGHHHGSCSTGEYKNNSMKQHIMSNMPALGECQCTSNGVTSEAAEVTEVWVSLSKVSSQKCSSWSALCIIAYMISDESWCSTY